MLMFATIPNYKRVIVKKLHKQYPHERYQPTLSVNPYAQI